MKKFLLLCAAMMLSSIGFAQTTVPGVWAWNPSSTQANYFRAIMDQANQNQKKYQFIFDSKPGAGGSIAARHVADQTTVTLLGTGAGFFIRPQLFQNPGFSYDQFKPVHFMAAAPFALVSKDKDLKTIMAQDKITIGTAGPGSTPHLFALKFKEFYPNKDIVLVPYKGTPEAVTDVLGGHIDMAWELLGDAEARTPRIVAITGAQKVKNYPLFKDIGITNLGEQYAMHFILVNKSTPDFVVAELREIFAEADKGTRVQELYKSDISSKPWNLKTAEDYQRWFNDRIRFYQATTKGMQKIDN
jgi:tripartite-type tricarboxylate transporter receptor subunit TctC